MDMQSREKIIYNKESMSRTYDCLVRGSDEDIIKWLARQGFHFTRASIEEFHDIGDEFAHETIRTENADTIAAFVKNGYGPWSVTAFFHDWQVIIDTKSQNTPDPIGFFYPISANEQLQPVFEEFKKIFCSLDVYTVEYYNH